jgi:hypothetical protein
MQVVNTEPNMPSAHNASFLLYTRAIAGAVRRLAHEAQKDLVALASHVLRLSTRNVSRVFGAGDGI